MKLHKALFLKLLKDVGMSPWWCVIELGMTIIELREHLNKGKPFDYNQSKRILEMFGATAMIPVIDWEGMNVRCPL